MYVSVLVYRLHVYVYMFTLSIYYLSIYPYVSVCLVYRLHVYVFTLLIYLLPIYLSICFCLSIYPSANTYIEKDFKIVVMRLGISITPYGNICHANSHSIFLTFSLRVYFMVACT